MVEGVTETVNLNSRLIASASWNAARMELSIDFRDGHNRTVKVSRELFENLVTASSPGWYYIRHIKPLEKM